MTVHDYHEDPAQFYRLYSESSFSLTVSRNRFSTTLTIRLLPTLYCRIQIQCPKVLINSIFICLANIHAKSERAFCDRKRVPASSDAADTNVSSPYGRSCKQQQLVTADGAAADDAWQLC